MDISFDVGTSCFNVRTCAVMLCGENLLVMKDKKLPYACLLYTSMDVQEMTKPGIPGKKRLAKNKKKEKVEG